MDLTFDNGNFLHKGFWLQLGRDGPWPQDEKHEAVKYDSEQNESKRRSIIFFFHGNRGNSSCPY